VRFLVFFGIIFSGKYRCGKFNLTRHALANWDAARLIFASHCGKSGLVQFLGICLGRHKSGMLFSCKYESG